MLIQFRVYDTMTHEDVTDEQEWYISSDGTLYYMTNDTEFTLCEAGEEYYYELVE